MAPGCDSFSDNEHMLFFLSAKIGKYMRRQAAEYLRDSDAKEWQFPILHIIYDNDGISQKEITSHVPFDKSRVSVMVNEMIRDGLITDTGEGRNSCLHLTDSGRQVNAMGIMFVRMSLKELFGVYSDEEKVQFDNLIRKLNDHLDGYLLQNK